MTSKSAKASSRRERLPKFSSVLFFCSLVTLLAGHGWTFATRRSLHARVEELQHEHLGLKRTAAQWKAERSQAECDKDFVLKIFRHCRSGEDIPQLGGDRIVSNLIDSNSIAFYVPRGGHKLVINASWEPLPATASSGVSIDEPPAAALPAAIDVALVGKQSWTIDLIGEGGYFFAVPENFRKQVKLKWDLSSNAAEFETQSQSLPLPLLGTKGTSWRRFRIAEFPNQANFQSLFNRSTNAIVPQPLGIGKWTNHVQIDQAEWRVRFEMEIVSDSPSVISASTVESLLRFNRPRRWISGYLGGGRYSVADQ